MLEYKRIVCLIVIIAYLCYSICQRLSKILSYLPYTHSKSQLLITVDEIVRE